MNYKEIYDSSEIFSKTRCIQRENTFVDFLRHVLSSLGYTPQDSANFVWQRGEKRVWLVMVDDIQGIANSFLFDVYNQLTHNDIIITDNWFARPINAKIFKVPDSWFGIYAHRPELSITDPIKSYSMAINRIDQNRVRMLLELTFRGHLTNDGLVNFNCVWHSDNGTEQDKVNRWVEIFNTIDSRTQSQYRGPFDKLTPLMPFNNMPPEINTIELQHQAALLNIVVETYCSDFAVALSEKTFRALTMPRPWRIFGGIWTVKHLESLGFDCMTDVSKHETDGLKLVEDKITRFVYGSKVVWSETDWSKIKNRAIDAAEHNIELLFEMQKKWPGEFSEWLPGVIKEIE